MTCCQISVKKIADECGIKVDDVKKLIPNLGDKTNYLVTKLSSSIYHWGQ